MSKDIRQLNSESRPPLQTFSYPYTNSIVAVTGLTLVLTVVVFDIYSLGFAIFPIIFGLIGTGYFYFFARKKMVEAGRFRPPHKAYPKVLQWKEGDKIKVDDPYKTGRKYPYTPIVVSGYYQGVLNDYTLLFSDKENLAESEKTWRVSADTLRIVDSAWISEGVINYSLEERRKEVRKNNAEELLNNSDYNDLLNELKTKHLPTH